MDGMERGAKCPDFFLSQNSSGDRICGDPRNSRAPRVVSGLEPRHRRAVEGSIMMEKIPRAIGRALYDVKPGLEKTLYYDRMLADVPEAILISCPDFHDGQPMPERFTLDGETVSPPLSWKGVPSATKALVLVMEDADSPTPHPLTHAIVLDLPPRDGELTEGELTGENRRGADHQLGRNSMFRAQYLPPDPPPGHGDHRYVFQLFALDESLADLGKPSKDKLKAAIRGHVLARGSLIGTYRRD